MNRSLNRSAFCDKIKAAKKSLFRDNPTSASPSFFSAPGTGTAAAAAVGAAVVVEFVFFIRSVR